MKHGGRGVLSQDVTVTFETGLQTLIELLWGKAGAAMALVPREGRDGGGEVFTLRKDGWVWEGWRRSPAEPPACVRSRAPSLCQEQEALGAEVRA